MDHELEDHDRGLTFDLSTLLARRRVLSILGGVGIAALAGCSSDSPETTTPSATNSNSASSSASASAPASSATCSAEIPEETAGPFPGDGSNGANVLNQSGIVRSDIRSSFGSASGVAQGIPLTITLTLLNSSNGCSVYSGAAVYLWHCNIEGEYSLYSQAIINENYLRGVQEADSKGQVTYTTIFPAAYTGRWPHAHFEVYPTLASATDSNNKIATSQLALPKDVCEAVYATDGYSTSVRNLAQTSLETDNVFSDGYSLQLATVTGSVSSGYAASLAVTV